MAKRMANGDVVENEWTGDRCLRCFTESTRNASEKPLVPLPNDAKEQGCRWFVQGRVTLFKM